MVYFNMASSFRNRIAEPLYVQAAYSADAEKEDIKLTTHEGQECDIVIEGQLKVQLQEIGNLVEYSFFLSRSKRLIHC